jgi:dienelactone hydrolase
VGAAVWRLALLALLVAGCTTLPRASGTPHAPLPRPPVDPLRPDPVPREAFVVTPERPTVEDSFILDLYTWLKGDDYGSFRLDFPGADGAPARAHLLLPPGPGPHPAVIVFPIRGGSHVVSEAVAKALVERGYAAAHLERRPLFPREETEVDLALTASRLRSQLLNGRRLLDWLAADPRIDPERLAAAGVSLGGMLAATLMGVDERIKAGIFIMAGGGLPEIIHDSADGRLRWFRERARAATGLATRDAFVSELRPLVEDVDPLTWAARIDPDRALLVSARFDRVVPGANARALWEAMGRPTWVRVPSGHYEILPFFWWSVGRGADLLDRVLATPAVTATRGGVGPVREAAAGGSVCATGAAAAC